MGFARGWKHTKRFFSKPFVGANKGNLKALDKELVKIKPTGEITDIKGLKYSEFDFTWMLMLDREERLDLIGEWTATLQRFQSKVTPSSSTSTTSSSSSIPVTPAVTRPLNPALRDQIFALSDSDMWKALQGTKNRYRTIAKDRIPGFFANLTKWWSSKRDSVETAVYRNELLGYYTTQYQAVNTVYEDCQKTGAENNTEKRILIAGGLYNVVKASVNIARSIPRALVLDASAIRKVAQNGFTLLNNLGGLIAGLFDLITGQEADFRRLTARWGLEKKIDDLKDWLFGPGDLGDLHDQVVTGPERLETAAEVKLEALDKVRKDVKHAQWWCSNWKLDIKVLEKEIKTPDFVDELKFKFAQLNGDEEGRFLKPSDLSGLDGFVKKDRAELNRQVTVLESKVHSFDYFLTKRMTTLNDLLAGYDTRRAISRTQKALASTGVAFDIPRQLALEIKSFDRSALKRAADRDIAEHVPLPSDEESSGDSPIISERQPTLSEMLHAALAERRRDIAPDDE